MTRAAMTNGKWFETKAADYWDEKRYHDGNNFISKATGSQWGHETMYHTRKGLWVLEHTSQRQGSRDTYTEITAAEAAQWFARQEMDPPPELADDYAALEG